MTVQDNAVTASQSMPQAGFDNVMKAVALVFLISQNKVFADILNAVLFNGRQLVQASEIQDYSSPCRYMERKGLPDVSRDVVKLCQGVIIRVVCTGIEEHAEPDPDLIFHVMASEGAEYRSQIKNKASEIYPVLTMVLYLGEDKPWDAPLTLRERVEISDRLSPYVSDYRANLFQIPYLSREQADLFKSDFRLVADYYVQKRESGCYHPDPAAFAEKPEMLPLMKAITRDERFAESCEVCSEEVKSGTHGKCDVLDRVENRGIEIGRKEGREEGKTEGEDNFVLLYQKLYSQGRSEDFERACDDKQYREQLKKELGIL